MQSYGIKYNYQIQIIFKQIYLTYTHTTTLSQSGLGSNVNEKVVHIPQSSIIEVSPKDAV